MVNGETRFEGRERLLAVRQDQVPVLLQLDPGWIIELLCRSLEAAVTSYLDARNLTPARATQRGRGGATPPVFREVMPIPRPNDLCGS